MAKKSNSSGEGNPKAASTRIGACSAKTLAGQIRHDLRLGPQPAYVDADRVHLNRVLMEPLPPYQMRAICEERRALRDTSRAMKSNAAIATRGIITFGSEAAQLFEQLSPDQQDAAFREVAAAVASRLETSLHGLVVHLDEATIHAHYQLAAVNKFGDPLSKSTSPRLLSELQDITAEIMGRHCVGIERGTRYGDRLAAGADWADVQHKSVKELHRTLPADLAAKRQSLADLAQAETDAAARVEEMRARVEKLTEKADLSAKEVKRLATYEKRLADRLDELKGAQAASEAARVEADRLADLARTERRQEEDRAEKIREKAVAVGAAVAALSEEVGAGTIRRGEGGRITAAAPHLIRPGYPEIRPVVSAAADFVMLMEGARAEIDKERRAIARLKEQLFQLGGRVVAWLHRMSLSDPDRGDGIAVLSEIDSAMSLEQPRDDVREGPEF